MIAAVALIALIVACAGAVLTWMHRRYPADTEPVIEAVNALLPQTQCAQCGYPGCRPYARALVRNEAAANLCAPGGESVAIRIAETLGRASDTLREPAAEAEAHIDEQACIGCFLCIPACPVDAIIGAPKHVHTVLQPECTGCELCVPVCPVNCIAMRGRRVPYASDDD